MTIRLGQATVNGSTVQIKAPGGLGTFQAVRLTNYTSVILIINGIDSDDPGSQEYLLPLQQNVYRTNNVSNIPTVTGLVTGGVEQLATVLVEWSDNPLRDFPGVYPTAIGLPTSTPAFSTGTTFVENAAQVYTIPANPLRARLVIKNISTSQEVLPPDGSSGPYWGATDTSAVPPPANYLKQMVLSTGGNDRWDLLNVGNRLPDGTWNLMWEINAQQEVTLQTTAEVGVSSPIGSFCNTFLNFVWYEEVYP